MPKRKVVTFSLFYFLSVELYLYYGSTVAVKIDDRLWRNYRKKFIIVVKK